MVCSILDIDLDYFNLLSDPIVALHDLLTWAQRPVSVVVEHHSQVLHKWRHQLQARGLADPTHILHVDEHHDMMDQKRYVNIANVMYHAMIVWPACRIHWLVEESVDWPDMWLDEKIWRYLRPRFSHGKACPQRWPRPEIVSVCISPEFVTV